MSPSQSAPGGLTVWTPTAAQIANSTLTKFAHYVNASHTASIPIGDYAALHTWSVAHPAAFWSSVAHFTGFLPTPPALATVLTRPRLSALPALINVSWLRGVSVNFAQTVLRHGHQYPARPVRPAIVYRPESRGDDIGHRRSLTFTALVWRVRALAAALRAAGVRRGDAVAGVLANTPDAVVALLAAAAVGAVWSCCSPDFGDAAVCDRLSQTAPKVLFYTRAYRYKGKVYAVAPKVASVVPRLPGLQLVVCVPAGCCSAGGEAVPSLGINEMAGVGHVLLRDFEKGAAAAADTFEYEMLTMDDPVVTMFSSGTTGKPKCIVQGCGILLNQMKEHVLHHEVFDSSVMLFSTSTGWMLFNWLVAALSTGCTIVLYDGAAVPQDDPYRMVHIAKEENVTHFGSGAKYFQVLKAVHARKPLTARTDESKRNSTPSLRMVMGTGSPSTMEHFTFVQSLFGEHVQYVSMSGGTEINGCFALGTPWKPVVAPELQCAGLGMDVCVFNSSGQAVIGESGELVCRNPCPCMPLYFGHDSGHQRYRNSYFRHFGDNIWSHGDFAVQTANGGFLITGRSDSTLNPGGVRIGTSDLYQVVETLDFVENALVAEQSCDGDSRMVMFVVTKDQLELDRAREEEVRNVLRRRLSPRHVPHTIIQIPEVPYTFSGKKCEIPVKKMLQGGTADNREAVKNPSAFDSIQLALERKGLVSPRFINKAQTIPKSKM